MILGGRRAATPFVCSGFVPDVATRVRSVNRFLKDGGKDMPEVGFSSPEASSGPKTSCNPPAAHNGIRHQLKWQKTRAAKRQRGQVTDNWVAEISHASLSQLAWAEMHSSYPTVVLGYMVDRSV